MGGKSKTQTTQQSSSTAPPDYVSEAYQKLFQSAQDAASKGYQSYGGQRVAGLSPEQEAGIAATTAAAGKADPYFGKAGGYLDQSAQAISPIAYSGEALQQFMNPFQKDVIDATMAQTAENDRRQQQDLTGKAIMQGAWGGDRAGVAKAELARQQKMAADSTLAGLNSQNFSQALQAFQQQQGVDLSARQSDAQRQASAGSQFMNLGQAAQDSALKDAYAQIQAGGVRQQNEQSKADADYEDWLSEQAYPFQSQSWLANILGGIGSGAGSTTSGSSTTKGSGGSNAGSYLGAGVSLLSALFSDERLKEDIEQVGETFDGQPIYRYRFRGSPKTQIGLMAQDVEDVHPEAVGHFGDLKMVDYERATDDAVREGFADGGVPYSGRVRSRIPDTSPMKFRASLMGASGGGQGSGSGGGSDSDRTDYGRMGGQIGGLLRGFSSGSAMNISPVSFGASGVGSVADAFSGDMGGFGQVYARGGVVSEMEEGPDGVFRLPRAWGGEVPYAETEDDAARLERELGMVTDEQPRKPMFFGRDTGYVESKPVVPVSGLSGVDPDLAARVSAMVGASEGNLPGVRSGLRSTEEQAALRERYLRGEGPVAAPPGFSKHERGDAVDAALAGAPGSPRRDEAVAFIDKVAPAWGLRQTVASEPWHLEVDPNWQGPIQGRNNFGDSAAMVASARPQARGGFGGLAKAATELDGVMKGLDRTEARATAFAPNEEGTATRTSAFDAVKPTRVLPLNDRAAAAAPAEAAADPNKGFGLGYLPKDVQMALIAAGLGMMGSRGHSAGQQIGEGGLAGLQFYLGAQQAKTKAAADERDRQRKILTEDRDYGLRSRSADVADKSLLQRAQEARERLGYEKERLGLSRRQIEETERRNKVTEEAGNYQFLPGQGVDAEGNPVAGTYKVDRKTGTMEFQPGVVTGAKPKDPEAELTRKAEFERLKGIDEAAEGARGVRQSVANLRELRKGVGYEGMPMAGPMSKVAGMVGYGGGQALESAATNFKLDLSTKLKGAISDKEQAMLSAATPGLGMSDDAANQTLATYEGVAERAIERQRFYQTWRARNKTLAGADEAWDRYVNDNPVVQADRDGKLALNRQNLGNWQKYVAAPVKDISSRAEYDKLKPGDRYRDPNGEERVKGSETRRASGGAVEPPPQEPTGLEEPGATPGPDFFGGVKPAQPYREGQRAKDQSGRPLVYRGGAWHRQGK